MDGSENPKVSAGRASAPLNALESPATALLAVESFTSELAVALSASAEHMILARTEVRNRTGCVDGGVEESCFWSAARMS